MIDLKKKRFRWKGRINVKPGIFTACVNFTFFQDTNRNIFRWPPYINTTIFHRIATFLKIKCHSSDNQEHCFVIASQKKRESSECYTFLYYVAFFTFSFIKFLPKTLFLNILKVYTIRTYLECLVQSAPSALFWFEYNRMVHRYVMDSYINIRPWLFNTS